MIPKLSEKDIKARVGEQSFQRGKQYFLDGAIFNARRQGMMLKGRCEGSRPEAYRVQVTFDDKGKADANCSCPVGGYCKHVAALLLTWCNRPEDFTELEELDVALERRSKSELIALIKQMLRREPELELLLETPLPTAGKHRTPVDSETYRRQVATVFRRGGYQWGTEANIADELLAIKEIGNGFLEQGDYANAAVVYKAISEGVLANYVTYQDEEGELGSAVNECVDGLGKCLAGEKDITTRESSLRALFEIYRFDVEFGGVGLGDDVPDLILEHATAEERQTVASWIRKVLPEGKDWNNNYHRQVFGGFLLALEVEKLDDETFLKICRETGRIHDLVDRLLTLSRLEEAIREAEQAGDYNLLTMTDIFIRHKYGDTAERLMLERSKTTKDTRILKWLKERYMSRGDVASALTYAEQIFRLHPGLEDYKEMRKLAQELGNWDALRPNLLALLKKQRNRDLLIKIYLDEGEIDQALEELRTERGFYYGYGMELEVAQAAEKTRPHAALEIYRKYAEQMISQRGRENYRRACSLLKKIRSLHEQLGESQVWTSYIAKLREQNRSLRAFMEELTTAKL